MRRILAALLFGIGIMTAPLLAQAAPCSPSMTFTTGQTLTAAVLNSNPVTFSGCFSNIDYTNIGAAGIFASQMMPTSSAQATFGSSQNYTFTNNLTVAGNLAVSGTISSPGFNYYASSIIPTTSGQATFGGSLPYTFPAGVNAGGPVSGTTGNFSSTVSNAGSTSTGAIKQTTGTTYTLPYDANSTSGSTNTHLEHGQLTTATFSSGFACAASQTFAKAYTTAPTVVSSPISGNPYPVIFYMNAISATAFQVCAETAGSTSSGTATFYWIAVGE